MARPAHYNKEGAAIMGAAAYHTKIFSVPELAKRTGIPYPTLRKDLMDYFGGDGFARFRAIVKAIGMTDEEIVEVVRCGK